MVRKEFFFFLLLFTDSHVARHKANMHFYMFTKALSLTVKWCLTLEEPSNAKEE